MKTMMCLLICLLPHVAQAKPWNNGLVIDRLQSELGRDLTEHGLTLDEKSVTVTHAWGSREVFNHIVMDWTMGQLVALLQDGKLWDDVVEQFNVEFTAIEPNQTRYYGKTEIAVIRYPDDRWMVQYYSSPHAMVATEFIFPKYTLSPY